MKQYLLPALALIRENRKVYLLINIIYYGLVAVGMVYVAFNPALQDTLLQTTGQAFLEGPFKSVGGAYVGGQVLSAFALTFAVNLFIGSLLSITVPSLILPFSGMLLGIYRAILWGLILSPAHPSLRLIMIPHMVVLILEGQAYILTMLASFVQGRNFLFFKRSGAPSAWRGYVAGLKKTAWLYVWIVAVLLAAALYEALEIILMGKFMGG